MIDHVALELHLSYCFVLPGEKMDVGLGVIAVRCIVLLENGVSVVCKLY